MTDKEIVNRLLENDTETIRDFFFVRCRAMLAYIGQYFCQMRQKPEELIGEFYEFLAADDWHKLRIFKFTCSLNAYVTIIASRYFQRKRDKDMLSLNEAVGIEETTEAPAEIRFIMQDVNRVLQEMQPLDQFLLTRILVEGNKPSDVLDDVVAYMPTESKSNAYKGSREQLAGYVYTRYGRAKKTFIDRMRGYGYGE